MGIGKAFKKGTTTTKVAKKLSKVLLSKQAKKLSEVEHPAWHQQKAKIKHCRRMEC